MKVRLDICTFLNSISHGFIFLFVYSKTLNIVTMQCLVHNGAQEVIVQVFFLLVYVYCISHI